MPHQDGRQHQRYNCSCASANQAGGGIFDQTIVQAITTLALAYRLPQTIQRGYGPTHSQSLEKHILGIPGTRVLAVHLRQDPAALYERLLSDAVPALPTVVIENKVLYGDKVSVDVVEGFKWYQNRDDFPLSYMRAEGRPDCVIVCYGGMVTEAEKAVDALFVKHDVVAEILCVQQLYPLRMESIAGGAARGSSAGGGRRTRVLRVYGGDVGSPA